LVFLGFGLRLRFSRERGLGSADPGDPTLGPLEIFRQLVTPLILPVPGVLGRVGLLRHAQEVLHRLRQLRLQLLHPLVAHGWCLEALAFIFVPCSAT